MTQCQKCAGRAQTFLCNTCTRELRDMLTGLHTGTGTNMATGERRPMAGWLEMLQDAVQGQTRLGESERRSTERSSPLMIHTEASRLLDNVHATLVRWVQDICDSRGVDYPGARMYPREFIGPLPEGAVRGHATGATRSAALWLAKNVSAIACDESAGMCYAEIKQIIDEIERQINRPENQIECGPCPTIDEDQQRCAVGLRAKPGDVEVTCWKCKQTHNVRKLIDQALEDCKRLLFSESEILDIMAQIGEHIPRGTWWSWRSRGVIESRNEWDAEPKYWLEDARLLWRERVGVRKTTSA